MKKHFRRISPFVIVAAMITMVVITVIPVSATINPDTSWYVGKESQETFVIRTAAELAGWSLLSQTKDFEGKTIYLGADIVFNTGNAEEWGTAPPEHAFEPILNFKGTFDGLNHTISGLYVSGGNQRAFIRQLHAGGTVKNLAIVNSYFSGGEVIASVVGYLLPSETQGPSLINIYSDAKVVGSGNSVGGIAGSMAGSDKQTATFERCVFNGSVDGGAKYCGGIIGNGNSIPTAFIDCANYGTISAKDEIGGIIGRQGYNFSITRCIGAGSVTSTSSDPNVGSILGMLKPPTGSSANVTLTDCYAVTGAAPKEFVLSDDPNRPATNLGTVSVVEKTALQGDAATTTLTNFNFNDDWDTVTDDYPLPKTIVDILAGNTLGLPWFTVDAVSVSITNDFALNFFMSASKFESSPSAVFTMNDKTSEPVAGVLQDGIYRFTYNGILPQNIGDKVTVLISQTVNGFENSVECTYSVKQYCYEQLNSGNADIKLQTLLVNLLEYGASIQEYLSYKTDMLVNADLTPEQLELKNTVTSITADDAQISGEGDAAWYSASLILESRVAMSLYFTAESTDGLKITVQMGDREEITFDSDDFIAEGSTPGKYCILFNNIGPGDYDSMITATFENGKTLTFSVASYIKAYEASGYPQNAKNLAIALYAYGLSVKNYIA